MPATAIGKPVSPILQPGSIATGLALCLPMHEGGGTVVNDLSGKDNSGTLSGGVTWTAGASGPSLAFNGSTGYVSYPGLTLPASGWSVVWRGAITAGSSYGPVVCDSAGANSLIFWSIGNYFLVRDSIGNAYNPASSIVANPGTANTFWAVTHSSSTDCLYKDGILIDSAGTTLTQPFEPNDLGNYDAGAIYYGGTLDFAFFFNRTLSSAEVASLCADSWQMVRPRRRLLKASGGGGGTTLWPWWLSSGACLGSGGM